MTNIKSKLKAAVMAPESGVTEPPRARTSSFQAQVMDLDVGETATRAVSLNGGCTMNGNLAVLPGERDKLRNNVAPAVRRAKEKIGSDYRVEVVDVLTGSALFVTAFVTRVA